MPSSTPRELQLLRTLTALPTVAGREERVVAWIKSWARSHRLMVASDPVGNLTIARRGRHAGPPIFFTAHLDHPAFVVESVASARVLVARFRGGVADSYFAGSKVRVYPRGGHPSGVAGKIQDLIEGAQRSADARPPADQSVRVVFSRPHGAAVGDMAVWDLPTPVIRGGILHAPACDDLAAVAAAIAAYERLLAHPEGVGDVRLFFTLAEEVGFIGAIGACVHASLPKDAILINLENSKAQPEAPLGKGPIVRVGDRISIFDPEWTFSVGQVADVLVKAGAMTQSPFVYQRKLMPGGACESTAFRLWGYRAAALCLPLGNYHNMDELQGRIAPEFISIDDYMGMVRLLEGIGRELKGVPGPGGLKDRLLSRYEALKGQMLRQHP